MTDLNPSDTTPTAGVGLPVPQAPTTPDPAAVETFGQLDTDPQAFIDDQAVEPVTEDLTAKIQQMEHERTMLRTQAMINIGIGLTMVQCGVNRMDFSHKSLAEFSSKYEVVSVPNPGGGYSMIVLPRDSKAYNDYIQAGIPAEEYFVSVQATQKAD